MESDLESGLASCWNDFLKRQLQSPDNTFLMLSTLFQTSTNCQGLCSPLRLCPPQGNRSYPRTLESLKTESSLLLSWGSSCRSGLWVSSESRNQLFFVSGFESSHRIFGMLLSHFALGCPERSAYFFVCCVFDSRIEQRFQTRQQKWPPLYCQTIWGCCLGSVSV